MRHFTVLTMFAIGALLAGCNHKSSQAASENTEAPAKADSAAIVAAPTPQNPPATFHPNKGMKELAGKGNYVVQVSVFKIKRQAESFAEKLKAQGFQAYVSEVESPTTDLEGEYYRVRIGGFATREEAGEFAEQQLKPKGFDSWVDSKSNDNVGGGASTYKSPVVVPSRSVYQTTPVYRPNPVPAPRIYHPPVKPSPQQLTTPAKQLGLEAPAPAPAPAREFPATEPIVAPAPAPEPAASNPEDSMRSPFADDAPSEAPATAPLSPYSGDSSGVHTRRVLPTW